MLQFDVPLTTHTQKKFKVCGTVANLTESGHKKKTDDNIKKSYHMRTMEPRTTTKMENGAELQSQRKEHCTDIKAWMRHSDSLWLLCCIRYWVSQVCASYHDISRLLRRCGAKCAAQCQTTGHRFTNRIKTQHTQLKSTQNGLDQLLDFYDVAFYEP